MYRLLLVSFFLLLTSAVWALKPSPEWIATPDSRGLTYQTTALTTPDHAQLTG
ncbi:hypothetical protein [Hymenobacter siberiensis]|jgi:hypothetical protein|uniref:hypothetical protein n=1 Tax=Hymenobacter siberiensis TaxID=2848396 RepID=UPI001C1E8D59|nr:hypothetical protein [Hymenobacter siberiensis]